MSVVCRGMVEFAQVLVKVCSMTGRRKLAEAFTSWVTKNKWSQSEVSARGGPSTTTQTKIRMTDEELSSRTLQQIDEVMGWPRGTAAEVAAGSREAPEPGRPNGDEHLRDKPRARVDFRWGGLGPGELENSAVRTGRDERGTYTSGRQAVRHSNDEVSMIEVSYWPGNDVSFVPAGTFSEIVGDAFRAAIAATSPRADLVVPLVDVAVDIEGQVD